MKTICRFSGLASPEVVGLPLVAASQKTKKRMRETDRGTDGLPQQTKIDGHLKIFSKPLF